MRALPAAVTLMDQARARKHDTDLGNRLTDQAFGLLSRDAVLTVIGLQNAGKLSDCGAPAREQVIGLAGAGGAGIGTVILIGGHEYVCEDRGARRVREDPAAAVNLAGEMRAMGLMEPGRLTDGAHDHQSPGPQCGCPAHGRVRRRRRDRDTAARRRAHWAPDRRHRGRRGGQPDPADCNPEVYDEGFWSRVDA